MRVVVQRVSFASVEVENEIVGRINQGFCLLVGFTQSDTKEIVKKMADKIHLLRIFEDEDGKMNLNLSAVSGQILAISQFTLYGDTKGNNRPSFTTAMEPIMASKLYDYFCEVLSLHHIVKKGVFGSHMQIKLVNDGPVTIIIEM
jgi:D-tyrosyl-tRNA(Tyr) deacylase